jgi:hypothetical protein
MLIGYSHHISTYIHTRHAYIHRRTHILGVCILIHMRCTYIRTHAHVDICMSVTCIPTYTTRIYRRTHIIRALITIWNTYMQTYMHTYIHHTCDNMQYIHAHSCGIYTYKVHTHTVYICTKKIYACTEIILNPIFYDIRAQSHPDPVASDESLGKDETGHASLVGSFLPFGLHI